VVTVQRNGELGVVPVAPTAGSVKRSTEKISVAFLATVLAGIEGFSRVTSLSNSSPWRRLGEGKVLEGNSGGCARPGGGGTRVFLKEEIKKGVGLRFGRG
jgi:hypothetical protein